MRGILQLIVSDLMNLGIAYAFWFVFDFLGISLSVWGAIALAFTTQIVCVAIDTYGHPSRRAFAHWTAKMRNAR